MFRFFNFSIFQQRDRVSIEKVSDTLEIHRFRDFFIPDPWNYGIAFGFSGCVRRLIADQKPDLIVINKLLFWTSLVGIPLRLRGHRVLQLTDAFVGMTWWPRGAIPRICAALYAWTLGWLILLCAAKVVTFHPQPPQLLSRLGIARKTLVIPTGIDPAAYGPLSRTDETLRITYLGRMESVKGVDDFAAAVVPLLNEFPHLQAQAVGWYKEGHPLVTAYGNQIAFPGLSHDVPAVLGQTDIFVLPSYSEGLSNALMEAMASGCACIASDVGGNRYLLQNGVSGFLFPVGDREALQSHLRRLITDDAKRIAIGAAARRRIEDEFNWDIVGRRYNALFTAFLGGR